METRPPYAQLPILAHREEFLTAVRSHRVTVINGETGSGKSSQVPRYLLDDSPGASILVTQPRRIAATSLARRVAEELGEPLGHTVGYSIGNDRVVSPGGHTRIQFVTSGWLLQKLLHNPDYFLEATHIVLDEVHERSVDSDLLYLLIRQLLQSTDPDRSPRIVMMSATFDASIFVDYYKPVVGADVPALFVGVKRFPVEVVYLEEFGAHPSLAPGIVEAQLGAAVSSPAGFGYAGGGNSGIAPLLCEFDSESGVGDAGLKVWAANAVMRTAAAVIDHIVATQPAGMCVLCFLPGIAEIEDMMSMLREQGTEARGPPHAGNAMDLLVLHSLLEGAEQDRAFDAVPPGCVRVVLATNIAESSVTLPGVTHVIDAGFVKTLHHDPHAAVTRLSTVWASQSSAAQRAGRCGRLCPGTVYRLYPRSLYERLPASEVPEMLRLSLATTVLRLKVLADTRAEGPFSDPARALAEALQPPGVDAVRAAVMELIVAGALTNDPNDPPDHLDLSSPYAASDPTGLSASRLSPLGALLSHIPLDPRVSKVIALATRCPEPRFLLAAIIMASSVSLADSFVTPHPSGDGFAGLTLKTQCGRLEVDCGVASDVIQAIGLYRLAVTGVPPNCADLGSAVPDVAAWLYDRGISGKRVGQLKRSVWEIARRLAPLLPRHAPTLSLLSPVGDPAAVCAALHFPTERELNFLRFMVAHGSMGDGVLVGQGSYLADKRLGVEKKAAPGRTDDPANCVYVEHVPERLLNAQAMTASLPAEVRNEVARYRFGDKPKKKGKGKGKAPPPPGAVDLKTTAAIFEFAMDPRTAEANEALRRDAGHIRVGYPPLGLRVFMGLFSRTELSLRVPHGPPAIISVPSRIAAIDWRLRSPKSKPSRDVRSLTTMLQPLDAASARATFYAVASSVVHFGHRNAGAGFQGVRVDKMTVLPSGSGLAALCLLTIPRWAGAVASKATGLITSVVVPRRVFSDPISLDPPIGSHFCRSEAVAAFREVVQSVLEDDPASEPHPMYCPAHLDALLQIMPKHGSSWVAEERIPYLPEPTIYLGGGNNNNNSYDSNNNPYYNSNPNSNPNSNQQYQHRQQDINDGASFAGSASAADEMYEIAMHSWSADNDVDDPVLQSLISTVPSLGTFRAAAAGAASATGYYGGGNSTHDQYGSSAMHPWGVDPDAPAIAPSATHTVSAHGTGPLVPPVLWDASACAFGPRPFPFELVRVLEATCQAVHRAVMGAHAPRLRMKRSPGIVPGCMSFCVAVPAVGAEAHGEPSPQVWRARESAWRTCLMMQLRDALGRGEEITGRLPAGITQETVADLQRATPQQQQPQGE